MSPYLPYQASLTAITAPIFFRISSHFCPRVAGMVAVASAEVPKIREWERGSA